MFVDLSLVKESSSSQWAMGLERVCNGVGKWKKSDVRREDMEGTGV